MTAISRPSLAGWRRPSLWAGIAEIIGGAGLSFAGCAYGVDMPPLPLVAMLFGFIAPVVMVILPGALLVSGWRGRWWFQALPMLLLARLLISGLPR